MLVSAGAKRLHHAAAMTDYNNLNAWMLHEGSRVARAARKDSPVGGRSRTMRGEIIISRQASTRKGIFLDTLKPYIQRIHTPEGAQGRFGTAVILAVVG